MSTLEDRLRAAYGAAAETIGPDTMPDLPGRPAWSARPPATPRWTRALIPLAAAASVLAIVAGLAITSPLGGHGHGAGLSALPPGVPRFYVEASGAPGDGYPLKVYDTASGTIAATIRPPSGSTGSTVVAAAGDSTFVTDGDPPGVGAYAKPCATRLYEFRLNDRGQPGPLIPLRVTVPGLFDGSAVGGVMAQTLSVTPGGRMIAYATDFGGCFAVAGTSEEIGVINTATGQVRSWTLAGRSVSSTIGSVALSADGRQLVFTQVAIGGATATARILSTDAPAGPVDQRSRVISRFATWAAFSADARSVYTCSQPPLTPFGSPGPKTGVVAYHAVSVASGPQHVIARWAGQPAPVCGASLDASGRYLLVQVNNTQRGAALGRKKSTAEGRLVLVDLRTGRLRNLRSDDFPGFQSILYDLAVSIAW